MTHGKETHIADQCRIYRQECGKTATVARLGIARWPINTDCFRGGFYQARFGLISIRETRMVKKTKPAALLQALHAGAIRQPPHLSAAVL